MNKSSVCFWKKGFRPIRCVWMLGMHLFIGAVQWTQRSCRMMLLRTFLPMPTFQPLFQVHTRHALCDQRTSHHHLGKAVLTAQGPCQEECPHLGVRAGGGYRQELSLSITSRMTPSSQAFCRWTHQDRAISSLVEIAKPACRQIW